MSRTLKQNIDLEKRLRFVDRDNQFATAAVIREMLVNAMRKSKKDTDDGYFIIINDVSHPFTSAKQRDDYIDEMARSGTYTDQFCLKAAATLMGVSLTLHTADGTRDYISKQADAPVFHIKHSTSPEHWEFMLENDKGVLEAKDTPEDGNCGMHALFALYEAHVDRQELSESEQLEAAEKDADLIENRMKAIDAFLKNTANGVNIKLFAGKLLRAPQPDVHAIFAELDVTQPEAALIESIAKRASVNEGTKAFFASCLSDVQKKIFEGSLDQKLKLALEQAMQQPTPSLTKNISQSLWATGTCAQQARVDEAEQAVSAQAVI